MSDCRRYEELPQIGDDQLKSALIRTLHGDPDPTVRINALAVLAQYPYNQQSQNALLQTLGQDRDVQIRLIVLEELERQKVGDDTIRAAVAKYDPDGADSAFYRAAASF